MIKETINLLGMPAVDRITSFAGIITSISFDLSGCVQAWVQPGAKDGAETRTGSWYDVQRLDVAAGANAVMAAPDFDARGTQPSQNDTGPIAKSDPRAR